MDVVGRYDARDRERARERGRGGGGQRERECVCFAPVHIFARDPDEHHLLRQSCHLKEGVY